MSLLVLRVLYVVFNATHFTSAKQEPAVLSWWRFFMGRAMALAISSGSSVPFGRLHKSFLRAAGFTPAVFRERNRLASKTATGLSSPKSGVKPAARNNSALE
jgi:hypothetical protein